MPCPPAGDEGLDNSWGDSSWGDEEMANKRPPRAGEVAVEEQEELPAVAEESLGSSNKKSANRAGPVTRLPTGSSGSAIPSRHAAVYSPAGAGATSCCGPTLLVGMGIGSQTGPRGMDKSASRNSMASTSSIKTLTKSGGLAMVLKSRKFECAVAFVILANCVTMGIEAEAFLTGANSTLTEIAEHIFTALFLMELILRLIVRGYRHFFPCLGGTWADLLDALLVLVTGVLPVWILPFFGDVGAGALRLLTVLRALRLIRLVRVVQNEWFQEVWLLMRGMIESMRMLFWTVVVIAFITYIYAIFGVVLISSDIRAEYEKALAAGTTSDRDMEELAMLDQHLGGVMAFMFTLVQVLTLDSWTQLVRSSMKYSQFSWVFFYMYVSLAVLVLMNLVTAVLVDNALMNSKKDAQEVAAAKEREKKQAFRHFRALFDLMDADGSGDLTRQEFEFAFSDPNVRNRLLALDIQPEDCEEIFNLLDSGDGVLSLDEFFEGLQRMEGTATAKDLFRVLKRTELMSRNMKAERSLNSETAKAQDSHSSNLDASPSASAESPQRFKEEGPGLIPRTPRGCVSASRSCLSQPLQSPRDPRVSEAAVLQRLDAVVKAVSACDEKVERCLQEIADLHRSKAS